MSSVRRYSLTKKDLIDDGYFVEGDKVFRNTSKSVKEIKQHLITNKHKYGLDKSYRYVCLNIKKIREHKRLHFKLHNVIYAWYKGEVPIGYEVDHIDGDSLNNNIDNLELVTHEENIRRCQNKGTNQWYYIKGYDRESWNKRKQELKDERNNTRLRKQLKPQYDLYVKILEDDIKKAKDSRDFKTWHELIDKRIKFKEFVKKYKESL